MLCRSSLRIAAVCVPLLLSACSQGGGSHDDSKPAAVDVASLVSPPEPQLAHARRTLEILRPREAFARVVSRDEKEWQLDGERFLSSG